MIIGENLLKICLLINSQLRTIAKSLHISYSQLIILLNIPADGISLSLLSNNIGIDNSTLTRNIEKIIAQKFQEKNKHLNFIYGLGIDTINTFFNLDSKLKNNLSEPIFKILKGNKLINKYATFFSN